MWQPPRQTWRCLPLVLVLAAEPLLAVVAPEEESPLNALVFRHPDIFIPNVYQPAGQTAAPGLDLERDLAALGVGADQAFLDLRGARWGTLILRRPLLPGAGKGNDLTWTGLGRGVPAGDKELRQAAWQALSGYFGEHRAELRIEPEELMPRIAVQENGRSLQVHAARVVAGVPVRGAYLTAAINGGNLVLLGARNWGDVEVALRPAITARQAEETVASYLRPHGIESFWRETHRVLLPLANGADLAAVAVGAGYRHRLAWVVSPTIAGSRGSWEALVDAENGDLLAFTDENRYHDRRIRGGVYPVSNDGQPPDGVEQPGFPMPFADVIQPFGTGTFSNASGLVDDVGGILRTSLAGRFVRINDNCGAIEEVVTCSDLDLGSGPGTDCEVPAGHSAGDTHSSRSGFYEVNRLVETAQAFLPDNAWLQEQLTANMNIDDTCNAFWDGQTINFFKSGDGCANTGEIAAVFDHEWGHGLDNNNANPDISAPGESIADIYAILRLAESCMGRGFVPGDPACAGGGYGDPCLDCTGVRDLDWAEHESGEPHDIDWILSPTVGPGGGCVGVVGLQQGPCGQETHCEGMVPAEAGWDLYARDLQGPPFNLDSNTALEAATRLFFVGFDNVGSWYQCQPGGGGLAGCNADGGYLNLLAADDDNGDLNDGTPHMEAIFNAFDRHQIACSTPAVLNGGCPGGPTEAPVLSVTPVENGAELSWNGVPGAERYWVFRTEGVKGCDFGKVKIAETTDTQFTDSGLLDGFEYFYSVRPLGASDACAGPMSACASAVPLPSPIETEAVLAFREVADAFGILSGDGDEFLDNCETAQFSFEVENAGSVDLSNVRITAIEPISHPDTEVFTPLPLELADILPAGCGAPGTIAPADFVFSPGGAGFDETLVFQVTVTADELPAPLVGTIELTGTESDFQFFASKTFGFETDFEAWRIASGTYTRQQPGADATLFLLASSSLLANQCDVIQSPEIKLTAGSTLSLFNQFDIEPGTVLGTYDRANVGIVEVATGARTTISPDGGRVYNAEGPNGVCVTQGQPGWAGAGPGFLEATWSAAALQAAGFAGERTRLSVGYGTDPLIEGTGFQFDEVTLTDFELQVPDGQGDVCLPNQAPVAVDDVASGPPNAPLVIDVLANDGDPDGDPISVVATADGANGSVTDNGDGTVTYTPDDDFVGEDAFTYQIRDLKGATDDAAVTVGIRSTGCGEALFADAFETGDTSAWSFTSGDPDDDLRVTAGAALAGSFGMEVEIDDNDRLFVRDDSPAAEGGYCFSFRIDPNSIPLANGRRISIFNANRSASLAAAERVVVANLRITNASTYQILVQTRRDNGQFTGLVVAIADEPTLVEVEWARSDGGNNGSLRVFVGGVLAGQVTNLDNDTFSIESAFLGVLGKTDQAVVGTLLFDSFVSGR